MDPALIALLSSLAGALLTVVAGFIGAWLNGRREHQKWRRDQRLRAYADHLAATDRFTGAAQRGDIADLPTVTRDSLTAIAHVHLLGPTQVYEAAVVFQETAKVSAGALEVNARDLDQRENDRLAARERFIAAARTAVKI